LGEERSDEDVEVDLQVTNHLCEEIERNLRRGLPSSFSDVHAPAGPWLNVLKLLYSAVRQTHPQVVVETGVGIVGGSSAFILRALDENGSGRLISIDPDRFYEMYGFHVGVGIPENLKHRITLVTEKSRDVLNGVLSNYGPVDLFLHDSCHTYKNMLWEFHQAWPALSQGGILMADDTVNSAFDELSRSVGQIPTHLIYGALTFGIVRKPERPKQDR
jgi:predicted O-methyltransferase YrrM